MILLTRLNNQPLRVNSDLIKFIEQSPDTVITLVNGEKLLVLESPDEVRNRIVEFRRIIIQGIGSVACSPPAAASAPAVARPAKEPPGELAGR